MDYTFPSWLLPAWILSAPVPVVALDHLRTAGTARNARDRILPRQNSTLSPA